MTRRKGLVLDANILLRAVFGQRARELLEAFEDAVTFYSPDVCFDDARKYIPDVSSRRRIDPLPGLAVLEEVSNIVESVDQEVVRRLRNRGAGARNASRPGRLASSGRSIAVLIFQSGQRTKTSLAVASPLGRPTALNCT
jgi:predicted nucleic acid-binding protein